MTDDTSPEAMVQKYEKELIADTEKEQEVTNALITLIAQVRVLTDLVEPHRARDMWFWTQGMIEHVKNSR